MKDEPIPPEHHISRWCKASQVDGKVVSPVAFQLEDRDTDNALSVNWLEFLQQSDRSAEIAEIQCILSKKMKSVGKNSRIAVLNVGDSIRAVTDGLGGNLAISVLHNPARDKGGRWDDPSHSSIYGLTRDDDALAAAVALRDAIIELYPAACNAG